MSAMYAGKLILFETSQLCMQVRAGAGAVHAYPVSYAALCSCTTHSPLDRPSQGRFASQLNASAASPPDNAAVEAAGLPMVTYLVRARECHVVSMSQVR